MSEEYLYWSEFFKSAEFEQNLLYLKKLCKNKSVVLYSNGIYFDALADSYNLNDFLNIAGICDIRYEKQCPKRLKGFKCISPSELKNTQCDYIFITSPNPKSIKKYLTENKLCPKSAKIKHIEAKAGSFYKTFLHKTALFFHFAALSKNPLKALKYFIFCTNEELITKTNYQKVLKKLKNKEKIRVLFVCEENSKWGFQSLYELMKKDSKFDVLPVVLYPLITKERCEFTQRENLEFFANYNIEAIDGFDYEKNMNIPLQFFNPDIVFYQQPWYLQGRNHPKNVSKFALCSMIPYGFTTLCADSWGSDSVKEVYSNLWMFFSESPYHNSFYKKAANMNHKDNLYACGCPKLDSYKADISKQIQALWKNSTGTRIIYAPHHSIDDKGLKMGNFKEQGEFFLQFAMSHKEYSFILKPHPALRFACINSNFMTDKQYDDYINKWQSLDNACVYTKGNYFDIFKSSDVLITDCSSFLAEYFYSKKPIIFLNRKGRAPFDSFGEILKKGFYTVDNIDEIEKLLITLLKDKSDSLLQLRLKIIEKYIYLPKCTAAQSILDFIKREIS